MAVMLIKNAIPEISKPLCLAKIGPKDQKVPFASPTVKHPANPTWDVLKRRLNRIFTFDIGAGAWEVVSAMGTAAREMSIAITQNNGKAAGS